MGARGAVILGCLSGGAILIGQSNEAKNLAGGRITLNVVLMNRTKSTCVYTVT